jgi:hypothetical protein
MKDAKLDPLRFTHLAWQSFKRATLSYGMSPLMIAMADGGAVSTLAACDDHSKATDEIVQGLAVAGYSVDALPRGRVARDILLMCILRGRGWVTSVMDAAREVGATRADVVRAKKTWKMYVVVSEHAFSHSLGQGRSSEHGREHELDPPS